MLNSEQALISIFCLIIIFALSILCHFQLKGFFRRENLTFAKQQTASRKKDIRVFALIILSLAIIAVAHHLLLGMVYTDIAAFAAYAGVECVTI